MESNVASTGVQQLSSAQKTGGGSGDGVSGQSEVMIDYGKSINPLMHLYKMMPQFEDACLSCMSQQVNNDGAIQLVPEIKVTVQQLLENISHYLATLDEKLKKHYNSDDNEDDAPSKKLNKKKRPLLHHATHSPSSFNSEKYRKVSTTSLKIPTGLKFLPTDEQLIENLFAMKVSSHPISSETTNVYWEITDCDYFYSTEPWNLPGADILKEKKEQQLFFYVLTEKKKNENGSRINRKAGDGSWKSTCKGLEIPSTRTWLPKGFRKVLKYHRSSKNEKKPTDWIMYEYRVDTPKSEQFQQYWTICKISRTGRSSIHGEETPATTTHDQVEDKGQQSYYHSTIDGTSGAGGAAAWSVTSMPEFERSSQETSGNILEQIMSTNIDGFDPIIWQPFLEYEDGFDPIIWQPFLGYEDLVSGTTEGAEPIQF